MSGEMRVHDFRLNSGGEHCSLILGGIEMYVQVGETILTLEQLEELYDRVVNFDEDAEGAP